MLLHGWAGSWRHWVRNVAALSRTHRLLVPDLPGMGDSDPMTAGATRGAVAEAILQGLRHALPPDARYAMVGFSFGGAVAGLAAAADGTRAARVTLVAPGSFGPASIPPPTVRVRGLPGAERAEAHRRNLRSLMFADPGRIDALALEVQERNTARMRATPVPRDAGVLQEAVRDMATTPHFIWGARDNFCGERLDQHLGLVRTLRPSGAPVRVIEAAGHWVAYEAADAFDAALLGSLA